MKTKRMALAFIANVVLWLPPMLQAQSLPLPRRSFSYTVVSVRPTKAGEANYEINDLPDGLRVRGATLAALVSEAYGFSITELSAQEIEGGPKWFHTDRFDVDAKLDESDLAEFKIDDAYWKSITNFLSAMASRTPTTRMLMLRKILVDRFQLQVHDQVKMLPVYTLLVAKPGQPLPGLKKAANPEHGSLQLNEGELHGEGVPLALLPSLFAGEMGRPILDGTHLPGTYDFTLKWTPGLSGAGETGGTAPQGPGLLTALQEQLGLRLQAGKGPVHVTVIDHAEQPSEN